jgi:hypothetical protein
MPKKEQVVADEAASGAVRQDAAADVNNEFATSGGEQVAPSGEQAVSANPSPVVHVETGDVQTDERTVYARNKTAALFTLADGTPFPRNRKKWLTAGEAARFERLGVIVRLN